MREVDFHLKNSVHSLFETTGKRTKPNIYGKGFCWARIRTKTRDDVDKKSHFRSFWFSASTFVFLRKSQMLKVTNHGHQWFKATRTNINCRESIFCWIFCLLSMAERTLLLYEPLQYPRWCNKISERWNGEKWIFETELFISFAFFTWTLHETKERWKKCKLFFSETRD